MHHIPLSSDTICAIATAPGSAGIALIRISGSEAIGIVDQVFSSSELRTLERAKHRTAYFGRSTRYLLSCSTLLHGRGCSGDFLSWLGLYPASPTRSSH